MNTNSLPTDNSRDTSSSVQGSALGAMVGWMSYGNRKFESLESTMRQLIPPLQKAVLELVPMVDADSNAFNEYMVSWFTVCLH